MPKAVADQEAVRVELKTAPPDGFVLIRQLTYGEYLKRRDMAQTMGAKEGPDGKPEGMQLEVHSEKVAFYEFRILILDHNLEDKDGRKLNFSDPQDVVRLDPKVAQEIESHITSMNDFTENPTKESDNGKVVPLPSSSEKLSKAPKPEGQST